MAFILQRFEKKYNSELVKGPVSKATTFEYAWCLIRSKYSNDIIKGIQLLEGKGNSVKLHNKYSTQILHKVSKVEVNCIRREFYLV